MKNLTSLYLAELWGSELGKLLSWAQILVLIRLKQKPLKTYRITKDLDHSMEFRVEALVGVLVVQSRLESTSTCACLW